MIKIAVLVSGGGTNLQALIDAWKKKRTWRRRAVACNIIKTGRWRVMREAEWVLLPKAVAMFCNKELS